MTVGALGAVSVARHSIAQSNALRRLALGILLSSVATVAVAQTAPSNGPLVPGSTNTPQLEQTNSNRQSTLSPQPPAPQATDVARPATGSAVIENAPQAPQDQGLGSIIVTATKRETNLQRTPIAISVANTQSLLDRHANNLIALGDGSIPSLRVATFEARQSALTVGIRGIVPFDQNQTAREPGVGVYLDGVYLGRSQGLNASLLDIDRIEVLRGPQGTLFGRNTEGGAVSIITRAPTGVLGIRGTVGVGNYGSYQGLLHVDLPSFFNLALKFDAVIDHQGPTVKNPLQGQYGWNYHNTVGGRVAGRWTPVDGLTVDLSYDRVKDQNTPNYSQLINYNPNHFNVGTYTNPVTGLVDASPKLYFNGAPCNVNTGAAPNIITANPCIAPLSPLVVVSGGNRQRSAEIGVPQQPSVDRTDGFESNIKYKVSPDLELRSITAWREVGTHQWDNSGGPHRVIYTPNGLFSRYSLSELYQHQFSQEFQAVGNIAHQLDYVLGAYYFREHATELAATPNTNRWNTTGTAYTFVSENGDGIPFDPLVCRNVTVAGSPGSPNTVVPNQGWDRPNWCVQRDSHARAKSIGLFGQATWTPAGFDILHVTGGLRWTKDDRSGILDQVNGAATNFTFSEKNSRVDPLLVLALDPTQDIHVYAKYSTGYRSGGANDRSATFHSFGPETVRSYEIGGKFDFLNHLARLNLAAYVMKRKGTQTDFDNVDTTPSSPTFNLHTEETRNAPGTSTIKGIEADFTIRPIQPLTIGASYTYTNIKVPPTPNPFLGGALFQVYTVYTPKHAGSAYADLELPSGISGSKWRFHLDANASSRVHSFQAEPVLTDPSFTMNGRIALADVEMNEGGTLMTFAVWGRNLTNNTYIYRRSAANSSPVPAISTINGVATLTGALGYGGVLGDYGNFNPPRTWGAEISFKIGAPRHLAAYTPPVAPPPPPQAMVTCENGVMIAAPGVCPPSPPPPPPVPAPKGERGE